MIRDGAATNTIAFQSVFVIFENHMHHGGMHSLNSDIVVRLYIRTESYYNIEQWLYAAIHTIY